jgi:hypothetical protein
MVVPFMIANYGSPFHDCSICIELHTQFFLRHLLFVTFTFTGVEKSESIGPAVTLKYIVDKTVDSRDFLFTLEVQLCLDGTCVNVTVINTAKVPIPFCNPNGTFEWPSCKLISSYTIKLFYYQVLPCKKTLPTFDSDL